VRWVRELSRGNGAEVSRAGDNEPHCQLEYLLRSDALAPNGSLLTSSVVKLRCDRYTDPILHRKSVVGVPHRRFERRK
jgi:hypothetical protein